MPKPIVISGQPPRERNTAMTLVPIGLYCNKQIQKAKPDSIIEFRDTWRREKRVLVRKCKVKVNSSVFTFLLRSIYGEDMRWDDLRKRWEAWAIVEGIGKHGFSDSEVLLLEVEYYDREAYNARKEWKRQEEERVAKQKEMERQEEEKKKEKAKLLWLAKRGIYMHEDILSE